MSRPALTIGIDPGCNVSGLAAWLDGDLYFSGAVKKPDGKRMLRSLREVIDPLTINTDMAGLPDIAIVVEAQHLQWRGKKPFNVPALLALVRNAGAWTAMGEILGARILKPVQPSEWRATFGLAGLRGDQLKLSATVAASHYANQTIVDHNEAEAILLALHRHQARTPNTAPTADN